jgi:hypothetical protein
MVNVLLIKKIGVKMEMEVKETLHSFDDDFPEWVNSKQVYNRSPEYYYDWKPKSIDNRYKLVTNLVSKRIEMYEAHKTKYLGYIGLFKIKDKYYVVDDGHRRVSLSHQLDIKKISAYVTELLLNENDKDK